MGIKLPFYCVNFILFFHKTKPTLKSSVFDTPSVSLDGKLTVAFQSKTTWGHVIRILIRIVES